ILVRDGKGEKDRYVPLPRVTVESLHEQIARVKVQHDLDLSEGYGTVYLPYALERKYPNTNKAFHWQYLFPSQVLSVDPRSGIRQRHHVYESVLQQAIRRATEKAGVKKDVHSHTFRHALAYYYTFRIRPYFMGSSCCSSEFVGSRRPACTALAAC
ncbi:MAG: tyrosine-type recombinase/integrase, partial [Planctomycetes bacterium]|nr:tyrosine-type recombinase/integrase [Planctomycetota bacterium]